MDISIMRAQRGDCIWIRWIDHRPHNIIIDSGPPETRAVFRNLIQNEIIQKDEVVDLFVLTHIDDDHIRGFLYYLSDYSIEVNKNNFRAVWFNTGIRCISSNHSPNAAAELSIKLNACGIHYTNCIVKGHSFIDGDVELKVITPELDAVNTVNKRITQQLPGMHSATPNLPLTDILVNDQFQPDGSNTNKASIAMVLTYRGKYNFALLGDAHDKDIRNGLTKYFPGLPMDIVKLSHLEVHIT